MSHWWSCCGETTPPPPSCNCMGLVITGVANGSCDECTRINATVYNSLWRLAKTEGVNEWTCTIDEFCGACGDTTFTLTYDSDTNIWTATAAGITWQAEGDDCDTLELAYVSSDGTCNGSGIAASIAPYASSRDNPCVCACQVTCAECENNLAAPIVEVTLSGFSDAASCTNCSDIDGTYTLRYAACRRYEVGCCNKTTVADGRGPVWESGNVGTWKCPPTSLRCFGLEIIFKIIRSTFTGTWYAVVEVGWYDCSEGTPSGDCSDNKYSDYFVKTLDLEGTFTDCTQFEFDGFTACPASDGCDNSSATVSVVSLSND